VNQVLPSRSWTKAPERTPAELAQVAGKAVELDRVIATHYNAFGLCGEVAAKCGPRGGKAIREPQGKAPKPQHVQICSRASQL
jgi:hypothetical protein